jgi:AcrR family transcriptional regulator
MSHEGPLGDETKSGLSSQVMTGFTESDGLSLGGTATLEPPAPLDSAPEDRAVSLEDRICEAAMRCVARGGLRKTTLDDVATTAGCSRATIYRLFPGGKDVLLAVAATREADRLLAQLARELDAASTVDELLVTAVHGAARALMGHEALGYLMVHEPGVVLPYLSFEGLDPVLARAVDYLSPWLEHFVDPQTASRTAEWVARLVVLFAEPTSPFDLTDVGDVRRLIDLHVLPGLGSVTQQEQPS